jgi:hypothetical protein
MTDKDSRADYRQLYARFTSARTQWLQYKQRLQEQYEYTQPYRNKFDVEYGGERKGMEVFDTTAIANTVSFTSKLMTALTPIGVQFMKLSPGPDVPQSDLKMAQDFLNAINDKVWAYMKKSNWSSAINESYYDLCCGTGAITTTYGSDDNPLIFAAHPLCNVYFEKSISTPILNVWRDFCIPATDVERVFPNARVPEVIRRQMDDYENVDNNTVEYAAGTLFYQEGNKKFFRDVVLCITAGEIVQDLKGESSPWTVYRWDVAPQETYGVGVTTIAMPAIKSLNRIYEYLLRQGAFASSPPFEYNSSMPWNPVNNPLSPGMALPITQIGAQTGQSIRPIDFSGDFNVSDAIINDQRNLINKMMFADPMGSIQEPVRTATEMQMRQQDMLEAMGPRFARLAVELLAPTFKRILYILSSKGLIPKLEIDGNIVDIEFDLPLAQAAGITQLSKIVQVYEMMATVMTQEIATLSLKIEELPTYFFETAGIDTRLVKSPQEMEKLIKVITQRGFNGEQPQQAA